MGLFAGFIEDEHVEIHGVEPMGTGEELGQHAATLTFGQDGDIHGFKTITLVDENGEPAPVHSIASGLDYPGIGPEHAFLHRSGRVQYGSVTDKETLNAFYTLSRKEGLIPALESSHAIAYAMKMAKDRPGQTILANLSGRGDKDIDYITETFGFGDE